MKVDELIEVLEYRRKRHGNVPVTAWDGDALYEVTEVDWDVYDGDEGPNIELQIATI